MKKNEKEAMVWLLGVIGVLFILVGIFSPELEFLTGVLIAIILWIIAGFLRRVWKVEKKKPRRKRR